MTGRVFILTTILERRLRYRQRALLDSMPCGILDAEDKRQAGWSICDA
jgi:hypothetical protein